MFCQIVFLNKGVLKDNRLVLSDVPGIDLLVIFITKDIFYLFQ